MMIRIRRVPNSGPTAVKYVGYYYCFVITMDRGYFLNRHGEWSTSCPPESYQRTLHEILQLLAVSASPAGTLGPVFWLGDSVLGGG